MKNTLFDPKKDWDEFFKIDSEISTNTDAETIGSKSGIDPTESEVDFNINPEELESFLNKYVIGQEAAVEIMSTKVCTHFNRMKLENLIPDDEKIIGNIKSNILLIGPTGIGKTYIIKLIAKKIGVPFVKADATKFSETGYVGGDVEDLVRELVHEAEGDINKAEYGIIYLDEIDKIASSRGVYGPDVSRTGVQRNLLKLMEESEVDLKTPHDLASQVEAAMEAQRTGKVTRKKINTKNILFIVSGAFNGITDILKKRLNMQAIGFDKAMPSANAKLDVLKKIKNEDLIEFGFESEFVGRLPVTVVLNDLDEEGLYKILKNKYSSVVLGKKLDFKSYGIELDFTDESLRMLARKASLEKTGARGLLSVFENTLIKFEKTLPSTDIMQLLVDKELIDNPESTLKKMLLNDSIRRFQKDYLLKHEIYIEFENEAIDHIQKIGLGKNKSIKQVCEDLFQDYYLGIRLMGKDSFIITPKAVENPAEFLDNIIRQNYKNQN